MNDRTEKQKAADEFYRKRRQWIDYVCAHPDVNHADFRVAYFMARKINADDQTMWWSVERIASEMCVSTATVSSATARLQDAGLMIVIRPARGRNTYSIRMPYEPEGPPRKKRAKRIPLT